MAAPVRPRPAALDEPAAPKVERSPFFKRLQADLDRLLREPTVEWSEVRNMLCRSDELDPNYTDRHTLMSTAHRAAFDGEIDVLKWCLASGFNVNTRTSIGRSVLHYACNGNRISCIRVALEHKADPNIRSLSGQTPLHICCLYNSYEAALELLHGSKEVIDVDVEDVKRQIPEALTKEKQILRAIRNYRANLDERRKSDLVEQALRRLFGLFDRQHSSHIMPEELAECQAMLARHLSSCSPESVEDMFRSADANFNGRVSWEEFRDALMALVTKQKVPRCEVLKLLTEMESTIFKESVRIDTSANPAVINSPVVSPRAKAMALRRASRPLMAGARSVIGRLGGSTPRAGAGGSLTARSTGGSDVKPVAKAPLGSMTARSGTTAFDVSSLKA